MTHARDQSSTLEFKRETQLIEALAVSEQRYQQAEQELLQLNEQLKQCTTELQATHKVHESFCHSISHDLRAPLRAMAGFSQALLEDYSDKLDEPGEDYLQRVQHSAQKMETMIDALLCVSRLDRNRVQKTAVDLTALSREVYASVSSQQGQAQAEFIVQDGIYLQADKSLLQKALHQLIDNALKFSVKQPSPRIEITLRQDGEQQVCCIADNGVGFDMIYAHKLFQPFQRLHGVSEYPGCGIGLVIVQHIIQRHGGRVWAEAELNRGARFCFVI